MSLLPIILDNALSNMFRQSRRITNQLARQMALEEDHFFRNSPTALHHMHNNLLKSINNEFNSIFYDQQNGGSKFSSRIKCDPDKFEAKFDVGQFQPEDLKVSIDGNSVTIEGKHEGRHEEEQDEHGFVSQQIVRKFQRRLMLPDNCDLKQVESRLSADGILSISAPRIPREKSENYREIPIKKGDAQEKIEAEKK